jgi:hypothetical protein
MNDQDLTKTDYDPDRSSALSLFDTMLNFVVNLLENERDPRAGPMNDQYHSLSLSDPDRSLVLSHFLTNFLQNLASCHTALRDAKKLKIYNFRDDFEYSLPKTFTKNECAVLSMYNHATCYIIRNEDVLNLVVL